ncbi:lectin C-type domain protein [Oesophagostomum dentatum]|uniref:Lectin C-type domain protein n=1 Tax=Oesophagostomum dentatum TaxID=61180 RepID=A0A0B1SWK8_OESDE|nr:lectin C-type domain protein [Oesophagostomum dentatum]
MFSISTIFIFALIGSVILDDALAQQESSTLEERFASLVSHVQVLSGQLEEAQKRVAQLERIAHTHPNGTDISAGRAEQEAERSQGSATDGAFSYKLFNQRMTWEDAQNYCNSLNARLPVIDSQEKNNFIKGVLKRMLPPDRAWIGTKVRATFASPRRTYNNFDKENLIDGCAVMNRRGLWSIRSCDQLYPFVCEIMEPPK